MIHFKQFSIQEAESMMNDWIASQGQELPSVRQEYEQIRKDLEGLYPDISGDRKDYCTDVEMGINLYEYLGKQEWFNMRLAADDSFWRTMTVQIAPHLVAKRWSYDNTDRYYKKTRRIWFKEIWWYVYLSLVPSRLDKTKEILLSKNCTTDTMEHIVGRPGGDGYNVKLCRKIMACYAKATSSRPASELLRSVMKLNTARTMVMEPVLCKGGFDGYVKSLFEDLNATVNN